MIFFSFSVDKFYLLVYFIYLFEFIYFYSFPFLSFSIFKMIRSNTNNDYNYNKHFSDMSSFHFIIESNIMLGTISNVIVSVIF